MARNHGSIVLDAGPTGILDRDIVKMSSVTDQKAKSDKRGNSVAQRFVDPVHGNSKGKPKQDKPLRANKPKKGASQRQ